MAKILKRRARYCRLPSPGSIAGRSSSITNAFFNTLIPIHIPTEEEELESLSVLGMDPENIRCAYCGDPPTEWDHLRPIITHQEPTGYITEIANLVPACGKCNQSKGKQHWRTWMWSNAPLSPASRKVKDLDQRSRRLEAYESWKEPVRIDLKAIVSEELWARHKSNWRQVLDLMRESQKFALELRQVVEKSVATQQRSLMPSQIVPPPANIA